MATASSAQREPSMEEILASIRRIIEDSDSGRKQPDDAIELSQDANPTSVETSAPDVDAFRAEFHDGPEIRKPFSLAEVQAQLATAQPPIEQDEASAKSETASTRPPTLTEIGARLAAEPTGAETPDWAQAANAAQGNVADWRRDMEAAKPAAVQDRAEMRPTPEPDVEIFEDELTIEPTVEADAVGSESHPSADDGQPFRPAIVSEHTGRQVAAAFGELSEAFASRGKKSFDEMAEDMLRPMLQDWLDNNLPTLVERLVREEIERVARGGA